MFLHYFESESELNLFFLFSHKNCTFEIRRQHGQCRHKDSVPIPLLVAYLSGQNSYRPW